ncbi:MAG: methyltransferase domain-containing protein [Chitinophagaceae bacterium]|nr:methyltransferase domain-containing protein [Chitinophagaceae bacterium]
MLPNFLSSDKLFLELYPKEFRQNDQIHFTPLEVTRRASHFLATQAGEKILDIGSGIGKFCIPAAMMHKQQHFFGIEIRKDLVDAASEIQHKLSVNNVHMIHGDILQHELATYDHFYFFNAFYEQQDDAEKLDRELIFKSSLYRKYHAYLYRELDKKPIGTKLATFFSQADLFPPSYIEVEQHFDHKLIHLMKIE